MPESVVLPARNEPEQIVRPVGDPPEVGQVGLGLRGPQGLAGIDGVDGEDAASLVLLGELDDVGDLPVDGTPGDVWSIDGHLWAWDDDEELWIDCGDFRGPQGIQGIQGEPGEAGAGAVESVNGQDGVVVLGATDVGADAAGAAAAAQAAAATDATTKANAAQAAAVQRVNHTGTQSADTLTDGTTNKAFLAAERAKLAGVAPGATANDTDANLKARANHTGTQPATTVTFTPTGTVAASDVQAAIAEVASEAAAAVATEITARDAAIAAAIALLINSAPGLLDTLDEIAAALGDDPNFAATMTTALAGKQPLDPELSALAGLASAANKLPYFSGAGTATMADFTAFARTLLDDPDAATARATLGLVIGTDVQGFDADLAAIATLASAANKLAYATGAGTWSLTDFSAFARTVLDDPDSATMRATLGVDATGTAVLKTLYDAQSFLVAVTDDTPAAVTVAASRFLGRKAAGDLGAMTVAEAITLLALTSTSLSDFTEAVQDVVGALVADGSGVDAVYDDSGNLVTIQRGPDTINAQTGTTYTLVLADAAKTVTLSNASAIALTVPANSTVAFPVGTRIPLAQLGAGQVTVAGAGGVTVNATPGLKIAAQYGGAELLKTATDTWLLVGRLSA